MNTTTPKVRVFVLKGAYGSGKGTNGKILERRLLEAGEKAIFIETSTLLKRVDDPTVKHAMANRQSVPMDIVCRVVREALSEAIANGYGIVLLDGFPRFYPGVGLEQVDCFVQMVRDLDLEVSVVRFRVRDIDFCHQRIEGRIAQTRAAGGTPRADDVNLEVRTRGLMEYFRSEQLVLNAYTRNGFTVLTISLLDPKESLESVAQRLWDVVFGAGSRVSLSQEEMRAVSSAAGGPVPQAQIRSWFRSPRRKAHA